jgi:hypothetical protein
LHSGGHWDRKRSKQVGERVCFDGAHGLLVQDVDGASVKGVSAVGNGDADTVESAREIRTYSRTYKH